MSGRGQVGRPQRLHQLIGLLVAVASLLLGGCVTQADAHQPERGWQLHGPLASPPLNSHGLLTCRRWPSGSDMLDNVSAVKLQDRGRSAVVLDKVVLTPSRGAARLRFDGAYLAPFRGMMFDISDRRLQRLPSLMHYRLKPHRSKELILRIGPSLHAGSHAVSRNQDVVVKYHTPDGQRYLAVFHWLYQYPNRPEQSKPCTIR